MPSEDRWDRNIGLFGQAGQDRLGRTRVAFFGLGGLGSHVNQQWAHIGGGPASLVDHDVIDWTSLNRTVGAWERDAVDSTPKVEVAARVARALRPEARIQVIRARIPEPVALAAVAEADVVIGALDNDAARLALNMETAKQGVPYLDLATDTGDDGGVWFGGRAVWCEPGVRCLLCLGLLDQQEIAREGMDDTALQLEARIYGVPASALRGTGPAVVSVNGVVASLGVTELMAWATGMREPIPHLRYRGDLGRVGRNDDAPADGCFICGR